MFGNDASPDLGQMAAEFPSRLLVMLYDEVLEQLDICIGAIEAQDIEWRYKASAKVTEILHELCMALDMKNGGEISANLAALYKHGIHMMTEINFSDDPAIAAALQKLIQPLRDSWAELDERIQMEVDEAEAMFDPAFIGTIASQQPAFTVVGAN